jgi:DMSO/TMAO reductase YedYZ heme-binding membrane subunit
MNSANQTSKKSLWSGHIISGLVVLFLVFDGVTKVLKVAPVMEASARLGFPAALIVGIGATLLACTAVYVIPRTSILGAILLTGYLGGAVVTNLRAGSSLFSETLFPVYFGILVWGGLYLRDARLRELIPLRSADTPR